MIIANRYELSNYCVMKLYFATISEILWRIELLLKSKLYSEKDLSSSKVGLYVNRLTGSNPLNVRMKKNHQNSFTDLLLRKIHQSSTLLYQKNQPKSLVSQFNKYKDLWQNRQFLLLFLRLHSV